MHICVCIFNMIGSDNGLSPGRLGTNFSEILLKMYIYNYIQENAFEYVLW